ncbi:MAG: cadherin-like beta sandwich domain-containing protein, partial [Petrotogales bacterium]
KLSVYLPVPKSMLDLGPEWLDRFVRAMLFESMALALEDGIINGTGIDNEPIGMRKDIDGSIDQDDGYPDKDKEELISLKPAPLGEKVMAPLTNEGKRRVDEVIIVVNPLDYWKRIFPQTTVLTDQGAYVGGVMPIPANVIQSTAVSEGEMIVGLADDYFMGIGSEQRIDASEHYRFLEDEMTYLAKQYANGRPLENSSFLLFDISNMEPGGELQLADLTVGSLTLEPEFESDIYTYTAETSDSSNNIEATPKDADATVSIFVNGDPHENDTSATWDEDTDNEVEIYVIKGDTATKYEITVTHSA